MSNKKITYKIEQQSSLCRMCQIIKLIIYRMNKSYNWSKFIKNKKKLDAFTFSCFYSSLVTLDIKNYSKPVIC